MNKTVDTFIAPPCSDDIELLYQDEYLLLINKPSRLLSLSGKNPQNWDSVHYRLIQDFPSATLVHRLDYGTSGIMVVALSKEINRHLAKQFQQRTVVKRYSAILRGHLDDNTGLINHAIAKNSATFPRLEICAKTGKSALTLYVVKERLHSPDRSSVNFTPETGRTHQLRIHAQSIGHPILGCDLYGDDESQQLADRLMLHAHCLEFMHPATDETIKIVCPSPF